MNRQVHGEFEHWKKSLQGTDEAMKDMEYQLEGKEVKIRELQSLLETTRENESRLSDAVQTLRDRVRELEDQLGSYQTVSDRGEYTISSMQSELREANDKIVQLEARLRRQLDERDMKAAHVSQAERRFADLVSQIGSLLNTEFKEVTTDTSSFAVDAVLTDLVQENALLKGKIVTLSETLTNTQLESKASRETIMRLVSEMGREQKVATRYTAEVENLRMERENALATKRDLEKEIELLKDRLEANQRAMDATRAELELRDNRLATLDLFENLDSGEEGLKEAVRRLATDKREQDLRVEEYETRIRNLTEQLDNQVELHRELAQRCKRYETDALDLDSKLRSAEGELAAGDVLRDGFKLDKEKVS
nr:hypothetical protein BaRGS_010390 [Batillaria attramentaria]